MDRMQVFPSAPNAGKRKKKATFNRKLKFNIATKFCLAFCRLGHCKKGSKCLFSHNVEKIAVCKKFIYGKCKSASCLLSHNLTPDKMPDCAFFLKGCCKEETCRYRHVKVNADAALCRDFLTGFCPKGIQCENSHQFLCRTFNKTGKCPKGNKCTFAHQKLSDSKKFRNLSAGDLSKYKKVNATTSKAAASATTTAAHASVSNLKPNNWEILNSLLTKRLKSASEANKQIVSQPHCKIDSSTQYIPLSTEGTSNAADDFTIISQMMMPNSSSSNNNYEADGRPWRNHSALKKKYFVIDNDEEKLSDYLGASDSLRASENICRPQLKIIPDFLLGR